MQAIVLVGGEGTRLRPLTSSIPKPALTLVDRPFLAYMVEWLAGHGVDELVLACGFLPDVLRSALGEGERFGARIRYVTEPEPLGTAGAMRGDLVVDGRNFLDPAALRAAGFEYEGIGKPQATAAATTTE